MSHLLQIAKYNESRVLTHAEHDYTTDTYQLGPHLACGIVIDVLIFPH